MKIFHMTALLLLSLFVQQACSRKLHTHYVQDPDRMSYEDQRDYELKHRKVQAVDIPDFFEALQKQTELGGVYIADPSARETNLELGQLLIKLKLEPVSTDNGHEGTVRILKIDPALLAWKAGSGGLLRGCEGNGCDIPLRYRLWKGRLILYRLDKPTELSSYSVGETLFFGADLIERDHQLPYDARGSAR